MLNKKYHIQILTPLGTENALLDFNSDKSSIEINKGSALLEVLAFTNDTFTATVATDVPFQCNLMIKGSVNQSKIIGKIELDSYLVVEFTGEETDGRSIPGLR